MLPNDVNLSHMLVDPNYANLRQEVAEPRDLFANKFTHKALESITGLTNRST